jgi:hypothetical protein
MMQLSDFNQKHKGERVFIVGNGPSLQKINLDLLSDEYSIAMNRIAAIYDKTSWRPSYFVCTTSNIKDPDWRRDILTSVDLGIDSFIWDNLVNYFGDRKNCYSMTCLNGHEITNFAPIEWWSDNIESHVTKFGTSMIVAFQIAVYMGFKEIIIIGADLGFKDSVMQKILYRLHLPKLGHLFDKNHFSAGYGTPGCRADVLNNNMLAAHKLIKLACDARGVQVFNATNGGALEIYPRVDFNSLI